MSIELYEKFKAHYDRVKPIRGRGVEVRPFRDRRRDWEEVICRVQPDGKCAYGARMHTTDVLLVFPNGDIKFDCGGWHTTSTAEFMGSLVYGMIVFKRYNKLWVQRNIGSEKFIATLDTPVMVRWDTTNPNYEHYRLDAPATAQQKVIDPVKTKVARAPVKEFVAYVKTMMKVMDGWITHDMRAQYVINEEGTAVENYWHSKFSLEGWHIQVRDMNNLSSMGSRDREYVLDCMCSTDEERNLENFPKLMVMFTTGMSAETTRFNTYGIQDKQFKTTNLVGKIERFVLSMSDDIYKYKEVVVTKPIPNLR